MQALHRLFKVVQKSQHWAAHTLIRLSSCLAHRACRHMGTLINSRAESCGGCREAAHVSHEKFGHFCDTVQLWIHPALLYSPSVPPLQRSRWLTSPISGVRRLGGEHTDCTRFSMVRIDCNICVWKRVSVTLPESQEHASHILISMNKAKRHWSVDCQKAAEGPWALPVLSGSCCWWSTVSCRLDRLHKTCLNPSYCSSTGLPFLSWPQCSSRFAMAFHKTHTVCQICDHGPASHVLVLPPAVQCY